MSFRLVSPRVRSTETTRTPRAASSKLKTIASINQTQSISIADLRSSRTTASEALVLPVTPMDLMFADDQLVLEQVTDTSPLGSFPSSSNNEKHHKATSQWENNITGVDQRFNKNITGSRSKQRILYYYLTCRPKNPRSVAHRAQRTIAVAVKKLHHLPGIFSLGTKLFHYFNKFLDTDFTIPIFIKEEEYPVSVIYLRASVIRRRKIF
ncbi:hypothetical protein Leryth_016054 [Lithospermum erythrorhizon]|nr:hypothetical protein Leryth_016054 [Lithospermum erythrorhizon]